MVYLRSVCFLLFLFACSFPRSALCEQLTPAEVDAILSKAQELYSTKEYEKAAEHYDLVLQYLEAPDDLYNAACTYSRAGRITTALQALENAITAGWKWYDHANSDPDLDNIRDEPGFKNLMLKLHHIVQEEDRKLQFWYNPDERLMFGEQEYELIGVPADTVPETARSIHDLYPFNHGIYLGYGDGMENLGPVALVSFQADSGEWQYHGMLQEHFVRCFRRIGNELYIPGSEPYEGFQGSKYIRNYDFGNVYRLYEDGGYAKYRTVPGALHIQDIDELQGALFCSAGTANEGWIKNWGCIYQSDDQCASWFPVYNTQTGEDTVVRVGVIRSFKDRLYAFSYAFSSVADGKFVYCSDIQGAKETIVYDMKKWHTEDLIPDTGFLSVSNAEVYNGCLILNARFYDPDDDSFPAKIVSKLYVYTGTGRARKVLDRPGMAVLDMCSAPEGVYLLSETDGGYAVIFGEDLEDFKPVLYLPGDLHDVSCITVHEGYLYIGNKEGHVYRVSL